jgi:hypothetical protein
VGRSLPRSWTGPDATSSRSVKDRSSSRRREVTESSRINQSLCGPEMLSSSSPVEYRTRPCRSGVKEWVLVASRVSRG